MSANSSILELAVQIVTLKWDLLSDVWNEIGVQPLKEKLLRRIEAASFVLGSAPDSPETEPKYVDWIHMKNWNKSDSVADIPIRKIKNWKSRCQAPESAARGVQM